MKIKLNLLLTLALWWLTPAILAQNTQPTLTISEALERGLARSDLQAIFDGRSALAESDVLQQRTWDNPELLISSEKTRPADVDSNESYLLVSQRIELFGIQRLRTQAARHQKKAVLFENRSQLLDTRALIKEWFYEVLYFQKRIKILQDWESKAARISEIIALREKAGEVSGYDRRRLLRELSEAKAMIARDRGFHAASWEQLRTLLELDGTYKLAGSLLPPLPEKGMPLSQHPKFLAYDEAIKAASLQEMAARHWKMPEITVSVGIKNTDIAGEKDTGLFLSARLPLPVFNRKKSGLMQARAKGMVARGEKALAQARSEGRVRALRQQIHQLRTSGELLRSQAIATSLELVDIAQLAYQAGEMEITVLLDAFRSLRDAEIMAVAMDAEARGFSIELEQMGGEK